MVQRISQIVQYLIITMLVVETYFNSDLCHKIIW